MCREGSDGKELMKRLWRVGGVVLLGLVKCG